METKHTPTPVLDMHQGDDYVEITNEHSESIAFSKYPDDIRVAEYARIVRACNSHEALVAELAAWVNWYDEWTASNMPEDVENPDIENSRAILQAAQVQS